MFVGASLSEPHTSELVLKNLLRCMYVCMYVSIFATYVVRSGTVLQLIAAAFERSVGSAWFVRAIANRPYIWHGQTIRFLRNVQTQLQSTVIRIYLIACSKISINQQLSLAGQLAPSCTNRLLQSWYGGA